MEMNKAKIIAVLGILVLSIFSGLFISVYSRRFQPKSERVLTPAKPPELEKGSTLKNSAPLIKISALPLPSPSVTTPLLENIGNVAKKIEESIMPDSALSQNISKKVQKEITFPLTESQFHFLYPDSFIADLADAQNLFIKEYDPDYQPILKIETDAQVRFIEEKIVATLLSADIITKERADQLVTTIRFTLPRLQLIDLQKYYSYGLYNPSPLPYRQAPQKLFLADLLDKLKDALAHKARASCGSCHTLPECFQLGASIPEIAGSELFYPSCYCTGCLTGLGCLSANSDQAAIYDQATGICGVGL